MGTPEIPTADLRATERQDPARPKRCPALPFGSFPGIRRGGRSGVGSSNSLAYELQFVIATVVFVQITDIHTSDATLTP